MADGKSIVVVFNSTFESLLSTALICEAMGAKAVHKDNLSQYMISEDSQFIHTDNQEGSLQFEEAMRIFSKRTGSFRLNKFELREIKNLVKWNIRYKKSDYSKFALILKVLRQCIILGPQIVLSQVTSESREVYKRSRKAGCEYHKACGFLRLNAFGNFLVTEAEFEHDVEDLVVRFWSKRYPEKTIVLFSKGKPKPLAYMGSNNTITFVEGEKVNILRNSLAKETKAPITNNAAIKESDEETEKIFEVFYDVQNIPARRNKRLARRCVPKKFSNRFRMREGIKIELGIQKTKLEQFFEDQTDEPSVSNAKKENLGKG